MKYPNNTNSAAQVAQPLTAQQVQIIVAETIREELARAGLTAPAPKASLTVVEVAQMLNVSKEMVYKMINQEKIAFTVISETEAKRTIRIPLWAVEDVMNVKK